MTAGLVCVPTEFRILARRGLCYVRHHGSLEIAEIARVFEAYLAHPDFRPGQTQLLDMRDVTDHRISYAELMSFHTRVASLMPRSHAEMIAGILVASKPGRQLAEFYERYWSSVPEMLVTVQEDPAALLDILGQPERTIEDLLETAA
ncbi:hypothetical protein [Litorisediminicola beolgyonensis]|uniref:Uncharacterized protein n=1 Tax=Litorisediminicola beolgyonensis TaxID=1173614 RepID=A0ABW3ZJF2_9RHOB